MKNLMTNDTNTSAFWKGIALLALVACAWMGFTHFNKPAQADNGGATTKGIIAMMGVNANNERLYLIDTTAETIMVYETKPNRASTLVAGRHYKGDSWFVKEAGDLKYNGEGYSVQMVGNAYKNRNP